MSLTFSKTACYQFNLYSAPYSNIQGYILEQDEHFIKIETKAINILNHTIKTIDGIICLSKNEIKNYYKISEN